MKKRSLRYVIALLVFVMSAMFIFNGCSKKSEEKKPTTGEEGGLQAGENDEDAQTPSVDFEDVFSDEEDEDNGNNANANQGAGTQGTNKEENKQENNKEDDEEEVKQEGNKDNDKEENKQEEEKEENKEVLKDDRENKEQGWGPFY